MNGQIPIGETIGLYVLTLWSLVWKGLALWRASKNSQRNWFIVLLVLNTVGILEIVFLFRFCKDRLTIKDITGWFKSVFSSKSKSK